MNFDGLIDALQQFVDWLVRAPWRDPKGFGFPGTKSFNESAVLPPLWQNADVSSSDKKR